MAPEAEAAYQPFGTAAFDAGSRGEDGFGHGLEALHPGFDFQCHQLAPFFQKRHVIDQSGGGSFISCAANSVGAD